MTPVDCFYELGCGLGRLHLARPERQPSTWPAAAVAEAFLAGEITWPELLVSLFAWEGRASLSRRIES